MWASVASALFSDHAQVVAAVIRPHVNPTGLLQAIGVMGQVGAALGVDVVDLREGQRPPGLPHPRPAEDQDLGFAGLRGLRIMGL